MHNNIFQILSGDNRDELILEKCVDNFSHKIAIYLLVINL